MNTKTYTKECTLCKEVKPVDEFYINTMSIDGLQNRCKLCKKATVNKDKLCERYRKLRADKFGVSSDEGINTTSVHKKFKGVCHFCERTTTLVDAAIYCLVSMRDGGGNTWDNVRIAHRECASLKYYNRRTDLDSVEVNYKMMKQCSKCREWKPKTSYSNRSASKDGRQPTCRSCKQISSKVDYERRRRHKGR